MLSKPSMQTEERREFNLPDPVHGMLQLTTVEMLLVNTPTVHRLRYIKAMGLANRVALPSATHTYFEHSLGTAHMTRQLVQRVYAPDIDERHLALLSVAALLHDAATYPFSHSVRFINSIAKETRDEMHGKVIDHLFQDEIKMWEGSREFSLELRWLQEDKDEIKRIATADFRPEDPPYYYWLFRSPISAHILDFLSRDAYYTGIAKRPLNLGWFIGNLRWINGNPNLDSPDIMLFLETLSWLRGQTRELVIDKRYAADRMFCRLVDIAIEERIIDKEALTNPTRLVDFNDEVLLHQIGIATQEKTGASVPSKRIQKIFESLRAGGEFGYVPLCSVEDDERLKAIISLMGDQQNMNKGRLELSVLCREIEQEIERLLGEEREYLVAGYPDMRYELYRRPGAEEETPDKKYIDSVSDNQVRERLRKAIAWAWTEGASKEDLPKDIRLYHTGILAPHEQESLRQSAKRI